jgi:CheY-like chemotaxis protein
VRLPLKLEPAGDPQPSSSRESLSGLHGLYILLVEDEVGSREGTARLLESQGAEVQAIESAAAAREAFALRTPDIVVSDIGLAGQDGYVLIRAIRTAEQRRGAQRVPALALTAFARREDRQRAIEAGFDAHLGKPVDPQQLVSKIRSLTDQEQ